VCHADHCHQPPGSGYYVTIDCLTAASAQLPPLRPPCASPCPTMTTPTPLHMLRHSLCPSHNCCCQCCWPASSSAFLAPLCCLPSSPPTRATGSQTGLSSLGPSAAAACPAAPHLRHQGLALQTPPHPQHQAPLDLCNPKQAERNRV
jgi:hypothetical protein